MGYDQRSYKEAAKVTGLIALGGAAATAHSIIGYHKAVSEQNFKKRQYKQREEDRAAYLFEVDQAVNRVKDNMFQEYKRKEEAKKAKIFRNPSKYYNTEVVKVPGLNEKVQSWTDFQKKQQKELSDYNMRGFWNPPGGKR